MSLSSIKSAAFSAIMIVDDIVLPDGIDGITEASTTRRFTIPFTLQNQISILAQIGSTFSWVPYQQITRENIWRSNSIGVIFRKKETVIEMGCSCAHRCTLTGGTPVCPY